MKVSVWPSVRECMEVEEENEEEAEEGSEMGKTTN